MFFFVACLVCCYDILSYLFFFFFFFFFILFRFFLYFFWNQVHHRTALPAAGWFNAQIQEPGVLHQRCSRYIGSTRSYLEMESEDELQGVALGDLRNSFCNFVATLCTHLNGEAFEYFFPDEVRTDLFSLFSKWCAVFGGPSPDGAISQSSDTRLTFAALQAIASLCRGPLFDFQIAIANEGYLCRWLVKVMACDNPDAQSYGRRALESLLMYNQNESQFVSWAIRQVYEADSPSVRENAFLAMANVLREFETFPISRVQSMCLALFMSADLALPIKQQAKLLLLTLKERFFGDTDEELLLPLSLPQTVMSMHSQDQLVLSRDLAKKHPEHTLNVFLELSHRFQSASKDARRMCLSCLTPWLEGIHLIRQPSPEGFGQLGCHPYHVLNNLLFMCLQTDVGDESLKLWASLCQTPENVVIILEYLIELVGS